MIGLGSTPMFGSKAIANNPYSVWYETSTIASHTNVNVLSMGEYVYYTSYNTSSTSDGLVVARQADGSGAGTTIGSGSQFYNLIPAAQGSNLSAPSGNFLGRFGSLSSRELRFLSSETVMSATSQALTAPFSATSNITMRYTDNYAYLIAGTSSADRFASISSSYPYTITTLPVFSSEFVYSSIAFRDRVYIKVGRSGAPAFSDIYVYSESDGVISPVVGFNSAFGASAPTSIPFFITKNGVVFNISASSYLINSDRTYTALGSIGVPSTSTVQRSSYDEVNDVAFCATGNNPLKISVGGAPFVDATIPAGNNPIDISVKGGVAIAATATKIFVARV